MNEEKRIVEINGVKMEVDLRTARVIENYRVGDSVKLLHKRYNDYEVLAAAIVGFSEFAALPTIELITIDRQGDVQFVAFNAQTKDTEIAPFNPYEADFDRSTILEKLGRNVTKAEEELRTAQTKRKAFIECFAKVFERKEK